MTNFSAKLISNVLSDLDFVKLQSHFKQKMSDSTVNFDEFGRRNVSSISEPILLEYSELLLPKVREFFSETLVPSYSLFVEYSNTEISLYKHKDANACTYTLDLVLYQNRPWGLWVEGEEFLAKENEAIMFWGEDQEHWRETVKDNDNVVGVAFFHYVEPDHWLFTQGPEYVETIRERQRAAKTNE
jgi:hypothetical protein